MTGSYGPITQVAWVVEEISRAEDMLSSLCGAGKWTRMPRIEFGSGCRYRGSTADFVADISLTYLGELQLELIQPVSGRSIYTEFLDRHGSGLHHVCFEPTDFDGAVAAARSREIDIVQEGDIGGGMRFAYLDCAVAGVPFVELASISPDMRALFDAVKTTARS